MPHHLPLREQIPDITTYCKLRSAAGLSPKAEAAARVGLANSLYAVMALDGDTVIGMGRVIGDGGCFFQVVDIAVLPEHQGRGVGMRIMGAIMDWLRQHVPPSGYVSLLADGQAQRLYARHGFMPTAPGSVGMAWKPAVPTPD